MVTAAVGLASGLRAEMFRGCRWWDGLERNPESTAAVTPPRVAELARSECRPIPNDSLRWRGR